MSKTSTLIYHEWAELFEEMPPEDVKTVILALLRYDITGKKPEVSFENNLVKAVYKMMLEKTQKNRSLFLEKCETNAKNGALGGRPKKSKNPEKPDRKGREGIGMDRIGEEGSGNNIGSHPPTLPEVIQFCSDEGLKSVDPSRFWNYYETKHWMIDGEPMNWQARIRVWDSQDGEKTKSTEFQNYKQRKYDFAELEKELLKK